MSDVLFKCPSCQKSLCVSEKSIGKTFNCPQCQNEVTAPEPDIEFNCPSCNAELSAPEDMAGVSFDCPNCSAAVQTPQSAVGEEPSASVEDAPPFGFQCPKCGVTLEGTPGIVGEVLVCPSCNGSIQVPKPQPAYFKPKLAFKKDSAGLLGQQNIEKTVPPNRRRPPRLPPPLSPPLLQPCRDKGRVTTPPSSQEHSSSDHASFSAILEQTTRFAFFTPTLLAANIIVFLLMAFAGCDFFSPTNDELLKWGANFGPFTTTGQWWRLFTSTFLHIGILHLALNMWVLMNVGRLVERLYGNALFILIYLASGVIGNMVSICVHPETVSAGASGAIFGLYGALVGFSVREKEAIPKAVLTDLRNSSLGFIGYNVLYGLTKPGIDNGAHMGGLVCGFILGYVAAMPLQQHLRKPALLNRMAYAATAFIVIAAVALGVMPRRSYAGYFEFCDFFAAEESAAIDSYNGYMQQAKAGSLDDDTLATKLETDCVRRWDAIHAKGQLVQLPQDSSFRKRYDFFMKLASLRSQALRKLVNGARKNDEGAVNDGVLLQQQADELVAAASKEFQ